MFRKKARATQLDIEDEVLYPWGGNTFSPEQLADHFMIMGIPRSGKTLTLRMLMRAVLLTAEGKLRFRAVVYDPKRDFYPLLVGMGVPADRIVVLNPFDDRSRAWNLSKDIEDEATAVQFATTLAPPDPNAYQPFFVNASQDLLAVVLNILRTKVPEKWTLNDVLYIFGRSERLKKVLSLTEEGQDAKDLYFANSRTLADVLSTARTKLTPYRTVARLWARSKARPVSLREWSSSREPSILLLGTDDAASAALDPINKAILNRVSQLVTSREDENPTDETWFFLDEAAWLGQVAGIRALLLKGRSKGAHVCLGLQDIHGMRAAYGQDGAEEVLAQCGNLAIFRLGSPATMTWASQYFGKKLAYEQDYGRSDSSKDTTHSVGHKLQERQIAMEQGFATVPLPDKDRGISGFYVYPNVTETDSPFWKTTIQPHFIAQYLRDASTDPDMCAFKRRDASDQDAFPPSAELLSALGLSTPPKLTSGSAPPGPTDVKTMREQFGTQTQGDEANERTT